MCGSLSRQEKGCYVTFLEPLSGLELQASERKLTVVRSLRSPMETDGRVMGVIHVSSSNVVGHKVIEVVVDRSTKLNALDTPLIADIAKSFRDLAQDDVIRAVVLSGAGKAWVVGADIEEMAVLDRHTAATFISHLHDAMLSVRDFPVPVIAKIHGFALGAGMELASACDLRIASEDARFGMPEVQVGLPSVIEATLLPGLMGAGRAARLMLTGEIIDAKRAFEWGFVEEVVASDRLDDAVNAVLESICRAGPQAVREQKNLLRKWEGMTRDAAAEASVAAFSRAFHRDEPTKLLSAFSRNKND